MPQVQREHRAEAQRYNEWSSRGDKDLLRKERKRHGREGGGKYKAGISW